MIIGITGGIGSGKSVVCEKLRELGYAVYNTDTAAKRLIMEDGEVHAKVAELFGKEVFAGGVYQTAIVAQQVFGNPTLLSQLNAIVHPAVRADIRDWAIGNGQWAMMFVECAILYEAGIDALCDKVVCVTASVEVRLRRVIARDKSDINKVRARMRAQKADEYAQRADLVIENNGDKSIEEICEELIEELRVKS